MGQDPDRIREDLERTRAEMSTNDDADRIRNEIEDTRAQMGETVEALGYKADVKSRVRESISEKKNSIFGTISGGKDAVVGKADSLVSTVTGAVPGPTQVKEGAKQGAQKVGITRQNPLGVAIGGAAVGFLVGTLLPSTQVEDEKMGDISDEMMDRVKETGQEALDRGKQVAGEATDAAKQAATESGRQHGQELASSVQESAQEIAGQNTSEGAA